MFKDTIIKLLQRQAKRYLAKHQLRVVAVTGSVGKTSTKMAIAQVLSQKYKVRYQKGNYNVDVSVPLVIFDLPLPGHLRNPFSWLLTLFKTEQLIRSKTTPIDIVVLELGADQPGDITAFGTYLNPDIAVVTAVAAEHMEMFKTIEAVAKEELAIAEFSKLTIINRDDIDEDYAKFANTSNIDTYGLGGVAEYLFVIEDAVAGQGFTGRFVSPEFGEINTKLQVIGQHNIKALVAAGAVGAKLGLTSKQVIDGMASVKPMQGRMNLLRGVERSTIIDDTYNSSPIAALAALQSLYLFPSGQRIAILGSMNELGDMSAPAHEQIGKACDPKVLDWVVTIGDEAEKYLASAAKSKGCQARSFKSPYEAGAFVHKVMQPESVILAKGSQNGVFAEEAIKILLRDTAEEAKLVRQSKSWLDKKSQQFSTFK